MTLSEAVRGDLDRWGPVVAGSALAAAALDIAARLEDPKLTPTPAAMLHVQLREALVRLEAMAPPAEEADELDDLRRKRDERRGA